MKGSLSRLRICILVIVMYPLQGHWSPPCRQTSKNKEEQNKNWSDSRSCKEVAIVFYGFGDKMNVWYQRLKIYYDHRYVPSCFRGRHESSLCSRNCHLLPYSNCLSSDIICTSHNWKVCKCDTRPPNPGKHIINYFPSPQCQSPRERDEIARGQAWGCVEQLCPSLKIIW